MKPVVYRRYALMAGAAGAILAAQPAAAQSGSDLEEVIVTATKQSTKLLETPISIAAYSQEALDARGVRDMRDVVNQTPGLDITRTGVSRVTIRGIDSTAGAATSAIYIDDTPIQARNSALNYNGSTVPYVFDVERVEVLRGPQGTLFGASSQGGAIRFITPTPSLTSRSYYGRASVTSTKGGDMGYELGAAVGGPVLEDRIGFRVSAYHRREGGWIDHVSWQDPTLNEKNSNDVETTVLRAAMTIKVADWLVVSPSVYHQNAKYYDRDRNSMITRCPATLGSVVPSSLVPCPRGPSDPEHGEFNNYASVTQDSSDHFTLPSLKVSADWGALNFTSVSSYLDRHVMEFNDATYFNDRTSFGNAYLYPVTPGFAQSINWQNPNIKQRSFTQEVRVSNANQDSRVKWTLGGYYSRASLTSDLPINSPHYNALYVVRYGRTPAAAGIPPLVNGIGRYYGNEWTVEKSLAVFASLDWKILDNLTLTLGGRKSSDKLDFDVIERGVSYAGGFARANGSLKETPFIPKVALSWQATPDALFYASYAKGYRTGGVNKALPDTCSSEAAALGISPGVYKSDTTSSYEVGAKGRLLDGRLQYEASAYHIKWNNIQQQLRLNCAFSLVANTASATSEGFDLNLNFEPVDGLLLGAGVGYTDATYDKTIQIGTAPIVVKGQTLGQTPWTVNLTAEYRFTALERETFVRAQYNYKSVNKGLFLYEVPTATTYDPTREDPASPKTLDLRAGMDFGNVTLMIYGENVLNNVKYVAEAPYYARAALWTGATLRPRTVGVQAIARY